MYALERMSVFMRNCIRPLLVVIGYRRSRATSLDWPTPLEDRTRQILSAPPHWAARTPILESSALSDSC